MFLKQLGHIQRLYGTRIPGFNYLAGVLSDVFSTLRLEHVGEARFEKRDNPPADAIPHAHPTIQYFPDENLNAVVEVINPQALMKPGERAPTGGCAFHQRGPTIATPNRDGDLVFYAPDGSIDVGQLYQDGVPIPPPIEIPDTGTWIVIYEDGEPTLVEIDTSSCP